MDLSEMERVVLEELVERRPEADDGRVVLQPDPESGGEFEKAIKRLERGAYIVIEDRFGSNSAVLRLSPRGESLWEREIVGVEVGEREITLDEIPGWAEPPEEGAFVRYSELDEDDRFEDKRGWIWAVPKQVDDPTETRAVLNRTAINFHRGRSGVVPEETWVKKVE